MARTVLESPPSMAALFARAAVTARGRGGDLPDTRLARTGVRVESVELAAYDRVCGFPLADTLPATYPHVLAFPLQLALMSDRSFPLALPGLVHVRNRVEVLRPVRADEALDLEVWAERFATHRSGATVDLCASVSSGGAEVWRSRSTYLSRGAKAPEGAAESDLSLSVGDLERPVATWRVPHDAGRRYAGVSGDLNPIHLSGLTAKAFGFKRAIAHGMWVEAGHWRRCRAGCPTRWRPTWCSGSRCSCPRRSRSRPLRWTASAGTSLSATRRPAPTTSWGPSARCSP